MNTSLLWETTYSNWEGEEAKTCVDSPLRFSHLAGWGCEYPSQQEELWFSMGHHEWQEMEQAWI